MTSEAPSLLISAMFDEPLRSWLRPAEPAIQKLLAIDHLRKLYDPAAGPGALLDKLQIRIAFDPSELERIPKAGPLVTVSNHPFGLLEALALADILPKIRADFRFLANSILAGRPELRDRCIFVNPFGANEAVGANASALRECLSWLRRAGALAAFPAGEVAHFDWKAGAVADPAWNPAIVRIAQIGKATVVPIFFRGENGLGFQMAGAIHPRLRTLSLPRELVNKRGRIVKAHVGRPIPAETIRSLSLDEATEYIRCRTYLLESQVQETGGALRHRQAPVGASAPKARIHHEISNLAADRKFGESSDFEVYLADPAEIPNALREIGRLREIAFRQAGEGAGQAYDLDRFDRYYSHLVLWNRADREIAGSYRLCHTPDILSRFGVNGLYTSTLFRYRQSLLHRIGPALELGRSFIRPEYQKQYAPLLLLWKGIARCSSRRPECASLFGAVSISNRYHEVSRHLIVRFLEAHRMESVSKQVSPRCPYRPDERVLYRTRFPRRAPDDLDGLSDLVAELENDGKGIPVLLKQYLKTGGRLLAFNVDRRFSNALDALIVVDLRKAPAAFLDRYMGKERAAAFRAWHSTPA